MRFNLYLSIVLFGLQWAHVPAIGSEVVIEGSPPQNLVNTKPEVDRQVDRQQDDLAQSTPVSQLQDIDPRHWAAQALRQLSQGYQCLPSYFQADAVISRYEFAEVLKTCLEVIHQAIADMTADKIPQEEWAIVQRLQEEFQAELTELRQRVDSLETQVSTLEDQQFVQRTSLSGSAEVILLDTLGDSLNPPPGRRPLGPIPNANTTLTTGNVLLEVQAKVRQQDFVRVGLFYSNLPGNGRADTGTDMTRLNAIPGGESISLNNLFYQTRYAKRGVFRVGPVGLVANIIIPDLSPVRANSRFGARNPIYRPGVGAGFLTNYQVNDWLALGGGYTVGGGDAAQPTEGFFNAQHRFIVQSTFTPTNRLGVALTYSHLYQDAPINITGLTGSRNAQAPFGDATATQTHHFGLQGSYRLNRQIGLGGWVNYAQASAVASGSIGSGGAIGTVTPGDKADIWSWALSMTVSDAFRKGNELGFVLGMPPKAVHNDFQPFEDNHSTSYHAEVYYRHRITPRFFITPGVYAVFNPEHNSQNNTHVVGLLRSFMRF